MWVTTNAEPFKSPDEVRCKHCGAVPPAGSQNFGPADQRQLRMHKCQCGDQMWVELPV
jgi:hypothetical protein